MFDNWVLFRISFGKILTSNFLICADAKTVWPNLSNNGSIDDATDNSTPAYSSKILNNCSTGPANSGPASV
jgi:hypothetical protein